MFSCMLQIRISLGQHSFELLTYICHFVICVRRHLAIVSFCVPLPLSCRHRMKKSFDYLASHADVLRGSSCVPAPQTSADPQDKFLSHCSQISAGDHMQIIGDPIGAVEVKVLTSQTHMYKLCRV